VDIAKMAEDGEDGLAVTLFDLVTAFNQILDRARSRDRFERLRELITKTGVSARKLANVAGCSVGTVCRVKGGEPVRAQIELQIFAAVYEIRERYVEMQIDEETIPLAVRLSQAITERGISARKLAKVAGYNVRTVYKLREGKPVQDQTRQDIFDALDRLLPDSKRMRNA
jgi:transcriptional regulator with XRE-family HTH domain